MTVSNSANYKVLEPVLLGDPLNMHQKRAIYDFVHRFFWKEETGGAVLDPKNFKPGRAWASKQILPRLAKTYDTQTPKILNDKLVEGPDFTQLHRVLKNPAEAAAVFGLQLKHPGVLVAAQIFMKVIIKGEARDFNALHTDYIHKLTRTKGVDAPGEVVAIRPKMQLLLLNDPVLKSSDCREGSSLDVVLSNIHFQTVDGEHRDVTRGKIRQAIAKLGASVDTGCVIDALAAVMQKEKGTIFIGKDKKLHDLVKGYQINQPSGVYLNHHSIMIGRMDDARSRGTFIHETLHFLFNQIVENHSSPVKSGSSLETLLDKALQSDRDLRAQIKDPNVLSLGQRDVYHTLVTNLEKNKEYFHGWDFDPKDDVHLNAMRIEAIVRVMECLAEGVSHEDIQAIAPALYNFYFTHAHPLIENYGHISAAQRGVNALEKIYQFIDNHQVALFFITLSIVLSILCPGYAALAILFLLFLLGHLYCARSV
jgi:hypothetical protein